MQKKRALIFGITGQDGSYLADFLLKKKYEDSNYSDKTQMNRLVLLFIGYPIILYSIKYYPKNAFKFLLYLTIFKIIIGFIYNLYNLPYAIILL